MSTPSRTKIASSAPAATAACLASALGSRFTVLRSQRDQRMSGTVITDAPFSRSFVGGTKRVAAAYTVGRVPAGGKWCVRG